MTRDEILALPPGNRIRRALEREEARASIVVIPNGPLDGLEVARVLVVPDRSTAIDKRVARSTSSRRGVRCEREGHVLDSQAEGLMWDHARSVFPRAAFFPHVAYPLPGVSTDGKIRRFTVDLLIRVPRPGGGYDLHAWEAKGPKKLESRDFILRWGAFRTTYGIPTRLFRARAGRLEEV